MESIFQVIKMIILLPVGIFASFIMGVTDKPMDIEHEFNSSDDVAKMQIFKASNPEDCKNMSNSKGYQDECYESVARWNADANLCLYIEKQDIRNACAKKVSQDCPNLNGPEYINDCYYNVAKFYNDTKWCEKISGSEIREKCEMI